MVVDGAVVPDWVGRVDLYGEFAGGHDSTVDIASSCTVARRAEGRLSNIVTAVEVEGDNVSNGSSYSAWTEGVLSTLTDLDGEGSGSSARDKSEKGECVNHFVC